MITLDTNLTISSSFYYLLAKLRRKYGYSNESIEKYAQAYASKSAPKTNKADNDKNVNNVKLKENLDYEQLVEDLKLNLPENRFALLLLLSPAELFQLLQHLDKKELLNGLKFFNKDRIMAFVARLPKKDLLKMLFQMFTDKSQLIEHLPTKELYRFLRSNKVEKRYFMQVFELLPKEVIAQVAQYLTRKDCGKMSKRDLLAEVEPFKKYQIANGIKRLDEKTFRNFITLLTESNPKLYNEFSHVSLFNVSAKFARTDIIDSMQVIDTEKIMAMLGELPDKLLALTVAQIDPEVFAQILLKDHKDLLANLVLA